MLLQSFKNRFFNQTLKDDVTAALKKALEAERRVAEIIKSNDQITHTWIGKRVPNPDSLNSRGEIDIIALAKNGDIFSIEVKNWAGEIIERDGDIAQAKLLNKNKSKNVIPTIKAKSTHLKRHLAASTNSRWLNIHPLVVLANNSAKPTQTALKLECVTSLDMLLQTIEFKLNKEDRLKESKIS